MKKQRIVELAVKVIVAALTAFLTAIETTSCMGRGPFSEERESGENLIPSCLI